MKVIVTDDSGMKWQLDTPDDSLVGPWMQVLFNSIVAEMPPSFSRPWEFRVEFK